MVSTWLTAEKIMILNNDLVGFSSVSTCESGPRYRRLSHLETT